MTRVDIKRMWSENARVAAADGTSMHAAIEDWINGRLHPGQSSKEFQMYLDFEQNWVHKNHMKPFMTEKRVFSTLTGLAGSIDMIYENCEGELVVVDWKRSKKIERKGNGKGKYNLPNCNFIHYSLQTHIYRWILMKEYGYKVHPSTFIVVLHPSQEKYEVLECANLSSEVSDWMKDLAESRV